MTVTKELQDVFKKNKQLKKVYFDEDNNHFFSKHEIEVHEVDDLGYSSAVIKVDALPGAKRNAVRVWKDKRRGTFENKLVNTEYKRIAATMTRQEILDAKVSYDSLNDKEKVEILNKASEIMKDKTNLHILKGLGIAN